MKKTLFGILMMGIFVTSTSARASECSGGQGEACPCGNFDVATVCIENSGRSTCEIPCQNEKGDPVPSMCSLGETCIDGGAGGYYCKQSQFVMDLNLLDQCIKYFVDGLPPPNFMSTNVCSLERNLNMMLDQTGDAEFDIFDVDGCINKFLTVQKEKCECPANPDVYDQAHKDEVCASDTDCLPGERCDDDFNFCRNYCEVSSECGSGLSCNKDTHYCECNNPSCPDDDVERVPCAVDAECGQGLFCDEDLHYCQRECGYIVNRGSYNSSETLERTCSGNLKTCQYGTGKCKQVDISDATCQVDSDCPSGAYCFVGYCEPKCYSAIQCPDSNWYCSKKNTCLPVSPPDTETGEPFDPSVYSILFSTRNVTLDTINDEAKVPILIMNIQTRKQVFDQPNAVFGYRLEVKYDMKQEDKCTQDFDKLYKEEIDACQSMECEEKWTAAKNEIIEDCVIDSTEEFITMENPFGTVYGVGDPTIDIRLDYGAVNNLTPGYYTATLRAIFNNGDSDAITITFQKPSPNGEYTGILNVYRGGKENLLGQSNVEMELYIDSDASQVEWDELLKQNNLYEDKEYIDRTLGYPVTGYLDGNASLMYALPGAMSKKDNKIPFKGIYSPHLGRLRLIAVIDLNADHCVSEDGLCRAENPFSPEPPQLQAGNIFGRRIRRIIEFIGDFDFLNGRYNGGYREALSGLVPADTDLTLEGDFSLRQKRQVDEEIAIDDKLAPIDEAVGFPNRFDLIQWSLLDVEEECADFAELADDKFLDETAFDEYLDKVDGAIGDYGMKEWRIFQEMINFEGEIGRALNDLGDNTEDYLTLSEYLKGKILFCPDGAIGDETCIDERMIRCGLALYRKALLSTRAGEGQIGKPCPPLLLSCGPGLMCDTSNNTCALEMCVSEDQCDDGFECKNSRCICDSDSDCGSGYMCDPGTGACESLSSAWVDIGTIYDADDDGYNSYTLFCSENPLPGSDCLIPAEDNPTLFVLQDHNRFYKEFVQTLSYEAGNALSDAFYVMYKAYQGDALDADTASDHKELRYYEALTRYEELRHEFFASDATTVAFQWPIRRFSGKGNSWLQYMHTVLNDRMKTLRDFVDLRRRVNLDTDESDYMYVQHMMHEEYLTQVFLYVLQQHWQQELFAYTGESEDALEMGYQILSRVNDSRNPLGFHSNQVFFENGDVSLNNWQNYKRRVENEMPALEQAVNEAITNMKNALSDQDNLESTLQQAIHQFDATIQQLCGPTAEELPELEKYAGCDKINSKTRILEQECVGDDCLYEWTCEKDGDDECGMAYQYFVFEDGFSTTTAQYNCRIDSRPLEIDIGNEKRSCTRGEMGALLQQSVLYDLQREQVVDKVQMLIRQIAREQAYMTTIAEENASLNQWLKDKGEMYVSYNSGIRIANIVYGAVIQAIEPMDCMIIAGGLLGTDCVGAAAEAAAAVAALAIKDGILEPFRRKLDKLTIDKEERIYEYQQNKELAALTKNMEDILAQTDSYLLEFEMLVQQQFNNELRIADTYYVAQQTAARYEEVVGMIVDHLIGRETGSVLLRNKKVMEANDRFQDVLLETYKMAQAFIHRYNLKADELKMINRVYQLQTLEDITNYIEYLSDLETNYCGHQGLDCDYKNNQKIFRLSLRDALFDFEDEITPNGVLTKGEKFHNAITAYPNMKKSRRASGVREQIDLPIMIWIPRGGGTSSESAYMVNPEECNHFIVGQRNGGMASAGTVAVNVVGTRLSENIEYELWRGETDYLRDCNNKVNDYEQQTNVFTVGWAPQHAFGQQDDPDTFLTHSTAFTACKNNWRLEDPNLRNNEDSCFNFFARDRSLGTLDMRFVIPFLDVEQSWIKGDGLPEDEQPIIEDIVIYFRYNSQPIYSDGL